MSDFVDHLELSVRTTNVLKHYGVRTQEEFMGLNRKTVMSLPHLGAKSWKEIAEVQVNLGGGISDYDYAWKQRVLKLCDELNSRPMPPHHALVVLGGMVFLVKIER